MPNERKPGKVTAQLLDQFYGEVLQDVDVLGRKLAAHGKDGEVQLVIGVKCVGLDGSTRRELSRNVTVDLAKYQPKPQPPEDWQVPPDPPKP